MQNCSQALGCWTSLASRVGWGRLAAALARAASADSLSLTSLVLSVFSGAETATAAEGRRRRWTLRAAGHLSRSAAALPLREAAEVDPGQTEAATEGPAVECATQDAIPAVVGIRGCPAFRLAKETSMRRNKSLRPQVEFREI